MKRIVLTIVGMMVLFLAMFAIGEKLGWTSEAFYQQHIEALQSSTGGRWLIGGAVIGLLVVDILLPIPSSIVMSLSGKLLGFFWGGAASFVGAMLAAWLGFFACRWGGQRMFARLVGDSDIERVRQWFERYGVFAIILSRPVPMLTEILSCLAGLTKVSPGTFTLASILGTLPICFVYSWFGNAGVWAAVWVALVIPALGWLAVRAIRGRNWSREESAHG